MAMFPHAVSRITTRTGSLVGVFATTLAVMTVVALAPDDASASPVQSNGIYMILAGHTGLKALDVAGGSSEVGTPVQIWTVHGGLNQRWRIIKWGTVGGVSYYRLQPMNAPGKCLDVDGLYAGAMTLIEFCNLAVTFVIEDESPETNVKRFVASHIGQMRLDVWDGGTADGTPVQQHTPHQGDNQRWAVIRVG